MSSATFYNNTVTNNIGDGFRIKGGVVSAIDNTLDVGVSPDNQSLNFGARVELYDNNYNDKYGSIAYFSGNSYSNASQVYNVTESRVAVQSELMPDPGAFAQYPVMLTWDDRECPWDLDVCLQAPLTTEWPPRMMPLSMELNENATTFTYADVQNFDRSKIHVQNQNTPWGVSRTG